EGTLEGVRVEELAREAAGDVRHPRVPVVAVGHEQEVEPLDAPVAQGDPPASAVRLRARHLRAETNEGEDTEVPRISLEVGLQLAVPRGGRGPWREGGVRGLGER